MKAGWIMRNTSVLSNHPIEIVSEYDNENFLNGKDRPLRARMFEGLTSSYPLYRGESKGLFFVVEHHSHKTRAGYEVRKGSRTVTFINLSDAINFYNTEVEK